MFVVSCNTIRVGERGRSLFSVCCAQVVKAAADETPLTLAVLRDYIEKEISEEASLTPEAAAKVR